MDKPIISRDAKIQNYLEEKAGGRFLEAEVASQALEAFKKRELEEFLCGLMDMESVFSIDYD